MGGGLLQLVAYGAQDVYLTGNPQITFFKVVYRRHTNFAMEAIQQTFSGIPNYGNTVYCQISRNGDLIHRTYLEVGVNATAATKLAIPSASYVNYLGLRLLKSVSIEIGGQQIDKHYSDWLYIWNELSLPRGKRYAYDTMVGADRDALNNATYSTSSDITTLYIPLEFWFCRNIGLALPLIALQYHEVKIKIEFESATNCLYAPGGTTATSLGDYKLDNPNLWVDYIYLDTDERRKFAQLSHEYLIEQLQFTGQEAIASTTVKTKLNFNHPCKELVWFIAKDTDANAYNWFNYTTKSTAVTSLLTTNAALNENLMQTDINYIAATTSGPSNPVKTAKLVLNGNDRFYERPGRYFNLIQPYQHHENIPANAGINVYSFSLKPEEHQPSGTLNMSRIDTAVLNLTFEADISTAYKSSDYTLFVYAVNYNVLRILSGMGGLAYSN